MMKRFALGPVGVLCLALCLLPLAASTQTNTFRLRIAVYTDYPPEDPASGLMGTYMYPEDASIALRPVPAGVLISFRSILHSFFGLTLEDTWVDCNEGATLCGSMVRSDGTSDGMGCIAASSTSDQNAGALRDTPNVSTEYTHLRIVVQGGPSFSCPADLLIPINWLVVVPNEVSTWGQVKALYR